MQSHPHFVLYLVIYLSWTGKVICNNFRKPTKNIENKFMLLKQNCKSYRIFLVSEIFKNYFKRKTTGLTKTEKTISKSNLNENTCIFFKMCMLLISFIKES